jgi:phosphohistidine phosphatase
LTEVYLVRHANAEERDAVRWPDDALRPLTPDGDARFRLAARGLGRIVPDVDVVLSSPYVRAWRTAEILHAELGWPAPVQCDALAAARMPTDGIEALRSHAARTSIALVGHEPYLSELVPMLLTGGAHAVAVELKKGGVVRIDTGAADGGVLRWCASPKILRALGRP